MTTAHLLWYEAYKLQIIHRNMIDMIGKLWQMKLQKKSKKNKKMEKDFCFFSKIDSFKIQV